MTEKVGRSQMRRTTRKGKLGVVGWFQKVIGGLLTLVVGLILLVATVFIFGPGIGYDLLNSGSMSSTLVLPLVETAGSKLLVIHAGTDLESSHAWVLDDSLVVDVPGGYGEYKLGAIWTLLDIDDRDDEYLRAVYGLILGQPVERVIPVVGDEEIGWPLLRRLTSALIKDSSYSNFDRWLVLKSILVLRQDLPTQVTKVHHIDELMSAIAFNPPLFSSLADECGLAIMNATDLAGLASKYSQTLEKNGAYVVRVDDAGSLYEKSFVILDAKHKDKCLPVGQLVSQLLPFEVEISRANDVYQTYRTPVALILGQDVAEILE
jgi:hypothetical protein